MQEKQQIQSFASQQAESFTEQIKQLQEQSMSDQERRLMKEQIIMVQQKLAEKETKYIKLDNELRTKKKEMEKLQRKLEDTLGGGTGTIRDGEEFKQPGRINNHQVLNSQNTIDFDELMNSSIDAITQRIQNKHSKSKDRSPSVPKLNFRNMKEF